MEREELICRVHVVEMSRLAFVLALLSLAVLHSGVVNGQGKVVIAVLHYSTLRAGGHRQSILYLVRFSDVDKGFCTVTNSDVVYRCSAVANIYGRK